MRPSTAHTRRHFSIYGGRMPGTVAVKDKRSSRLWILWGLLGIATGCSLGLWAALCMSGYGYILSWPGIPAEVYEIESVGTITPLHAWEGQEVRTQLVIHPEVERIGFDLWLVDQLAWGRTDFESPVYRVPVLLDRRGVISDSVSPLSPEEVPVLDAALRSAIVFEASRNQPTMPLMWADVYEGVDGQGKPLTVVTARGCGAGDTYPYYEAVFRSDAAGIGPDSLVSSQKFYYDVAGLEGWELIIQLVLLGVLMLIGWVCAGVIYAGLSFSQSMK